MGSSFLRFRIVSVAIYTITQNCRLLRDSMSLREVWGLRDSLKVLRVCMQMLLKFGGIVEFY